MHRLYPIFLLLLTCAIAFGQEGTKRPLPAIKLETAPVIDGDPSDEVWKKVEPVTGFWDIQEGKLVAEQTRVRLAYNATHIFVAFEMTDSKTDEIISKETQEDSRFTNDAELAEDTVDVRFDTFSTNTSGGSSFFSINSIGTKSANLAGGRAKKTEWKGDWLAFAKRTPTGWTAEMQIPWGILNYPNQKAAQSFGINFFRYHARLKLPSYWANIGPQGREELQGIWTGVETPAPPKPKLSVLPYIITGFDAKTRPIVRTGFDARFPLSAEMTAVGSVNPDFGTIEGAVESVGFSRTERSVVERRPFFLEGQNFFRAGEGYDIGQFFYPRRIRSFDIGTKLYGKLNKKDSIGIMQTMTIGERLDAVVNWSHKESPFETYGIFTNVKASRADNASVASANYQKEWGKFAFSTRYAQSNDNGKSALASANTIWYSDKNNFSFLGYNDTNDKFRIPDGLIGFTGIKGWEFYDELTYQWRGGAVQESNSEFSYSHNNK
ncbi:MAG: DUF5916 domain-containing protein, partial [Armatimonadetes bacterium]|nr:DUF5916 domain-containing protein [Armatimonadota bacterium]